MEILDIYKALVKETFTFKNFKRMGGNKALLSTIAVFPFILIYTLTLLQYGVLIILYKFINTPCDYLNLFLKSESKDVKAATQVIIYLIGFPLVFAIKAISAFLFFGMFILHFVANILGYFATIGGITFSPFIFNAKDRELSQKKENFKYFSSSLFATLGALLSIMGYIICPFTAILTAILQIEEIVAYLLFLIAVIVLIHIVFVICLVPIIVYFENSNDNTSSINQEIEDDGDYDDSLNDENEPRLISLDEILNNSKQ